MTLNNRKSTVNIFILINIIKNVFYNSHERVSERERGKDTRNIDYIEINWRADASRRFFLNLRERKRDREKLPLSLTKSS